MSWHLLQKSSSGSSVSFQKRSQQNCLSILKFCSHRLNRHTHSHIHTYTHTPHTNTHLPMGALHTVSEDRGQRAQPASQLRTWSQAPSVLPPRPGVLSNTALCLCSNDREPSDKKAFL